MLKLDLEYKKGILFVRLDGFLNRKVIYKITTYLNPIISKHKIKYVIYNLKKLKGLDESGVDAILSTKCIVKKNSGKIYICEVNNENFIKLKRVHIPTNSSETATLRKIKVEVQKG